MRNRVLTVFFLVILFGTAVGTRFYENVCSMEGNTMTAIFAESREASETLNGKVSASLQGQSTQLIEELPFRTALVELNGMILRETGTRSYYNRSYGMNITTTGYNVGRYEKTSTDYEVQQMTDFKNYLDSKGIRLLYVNEPAKYIDDAYYTEQFGGESYLNRNADLFLQRISEAGIESLDLRDCIAEEGLDPMSLFYRTDHHWTVPASLWAAGKIAEKLNETFQYQIDLSLYNPDSFTSVLYEDAWLGEQGRKVAKSYIGLDDYVKMTPNYATSYTVFKPDGSALTSGDFSIFIDETDYEYNGDYYTAPSLHYSYDAYNYNTIHNNKAKGGNILLLGDSYESSMAPFLSLGISDIKVVVLRGMTGSIREEIEKGDYDTVIIAYAQFMIGAHDNPSSANYRMFTLE